MSYIECATQTNWSYLKDSEKLRVALWPQVWPTHNSTFDLHICFLGEHNAIMFTIISRQLNPHPSYHEISNRFPFKTLYTAYLMKLFCWLTSRWLYYLCVDLQRFSKRLLSMLRWRFTWAFLKKNNSVLLDKPQWGHNANPCIRACSKFIQSRVNANAPIVPSIDHKTTWLDKINKASCG